MLRLEQDVSSSLLDTQELLGCRALLVESHRSTRECVKEHLDSFGLVTTSVADIASAQVSLAESEREGTPFDVIVVEASEDCSRAWDFAAELARSGSKGRPSVIMLASPTVADVHKRLTDAGLKHCLTKPAKLQDFQQALLAAKHESEEQVVAPANECAAGVVTVLIADDSPVNQEVAVGLLELQGYRAVTADNGEEAVDRVLSEQPDIVLMDIEMPILDGLQATKRIRVAESETGQHVPIVAMTAHGISGFESESRAAGMDGYISKPIQPDDLFDTLERILKKSRNVCH